MKICQNCGYQFDDGAKFCPGCGQQAPQTQGQQPFYGQPPYQQPVYPQFDPEDIGRTRIVSALSYIPGLGIIFLFVSLLVYPDSAYVRYHVNNVLALLIFNLLAIFMNIVPILGQIAYAVAEIIYIVIAIMGMVRAKNGDLRQLPIVGKYRILK